LDLENPRNERQRSDSHDQTAIMLAATICAGAIQRFVYA